MRRPDRGYRRLRLACLTAAALALWAAPVRAQDSCDLEGARENYRQGQFDEALAKLKLCEENRRLLGLSDIREVYQLKAGIYLALDDQSSAREAVAQLLQVWPAFDPQPNDPLSRLLYEVRREEGSAQVTVASRVGEGLAQAPGTLAVVTAAQMERRGYLDLEEVLHDLPGFDFSRVNGEIYSNLHPRGFRATANDRMLLLVDGVEQNDLSSGTAHLSRQYSLLNVERVEVLYGPASAIYGAASAYSGVINVVTRPPEAFLQPGQNFGSRIAVTSGSLDTRTVDFTLAGKPTSQALAWSVTGRLFRSSEPDLSHFEDWDYRYDVDYREILRLTGEAARNFAERFPPSPLYVVVRDASGAVLAVEPTAEAELLARELDRRALSRLSAGALSFSDESEDWSLVGRMRMANLELGFQTWRRKEGTTSGYTELARAGQGNEWTPRQTAFFVKFSFPVPTKNLLVRFAARYRQSGLLGDSTSTAVFQTYFSGDRGLETLIGCESQDDPERCEGRLVVDRFSQLSTQLAGELSLVYDSPQKGVSGIGGVDLKISSIQSEPGSVTLRAPPYEHTDLGLYAQATFNPPQDRWRGLRLVAAWRLDLNRVDALTVAQAGYGSVFSQRLAAIYDPAGTWFLKALYSRGIREPSDFERFAALPGLQEPGSQEEQGRRLEPEKVDSVELAAGWNQSGGWWTEGRTVEVALYHSQHRDLLRPQFTGECLLFGSLGCLAFNTRLRNTGELQTQGGHFAVSAERKHFRLYGNYTYTDSRQPDPLDVFGRPFIDSQGRRVAELRFTDLAQHRANLDLNGDLGGRWNVGLRFNYVAARKSFGNAAEIPSALLTHAVVNYRDLLPGRLPGVTLQLVVHNLLDKRYGDPGLQSAGRGRAEIIPQAGRTLYLRVLYQWQGKYVRP